MTDDPREWGDFGTPEGRIRFHEIAQSLTLSDDIEQRFRAITSQGIMNALERALEMPQKDQNAAITGLFQGAANSLVAVVSGMPQSIHLHGFALIICNLIHVAEGHDEINRDAASKMAHLYEVIDKWCLEISK